MWPSPRPEIIGTAAPQAAMIGASTRLTLSPTPPVECLSRIGRPRSGHSRTRPEVVIARVRATHSGAVMPLRQIAIASAAACPSEIVPSPIPATNAAIASSGNARPSRFAWMTSWGMNAGIFFTVKCSCVMVA